MLKYLVRILVTVIAFSIYGIINAITDSTGTLIAGKVAGNQFDASDSSYIMTNIIFSTLHSFHFGVVFWLLVVVLVSIWTPWKFLKNLNKLEK